MNDTFTDYNHKYLISIGFSIISRRYGIVSRIDRPDWIDWCVDNNHPTCPDYYRRCLSKDTYQFGSQLVKKRLYEASHVSRVEYVGDNELSHRLKPHTRLRTEDDTLGVWW
jgi:hypothetical protein